MASGGIMVCECHGLMSWLKGIRWREILKLLGKEDVTEGARSKNGFDAAVFQVDRSLSISLFLGSDYYLWLENKGTRAEAQFDLLKVTIAIYNIKTYQTHSSCHNSIFNILTPAHREPMPKSFIHHVFCTLEPLLFFQKWKLVSYAGLFWTKLTLSEIFLRELLGHHMHSAVASVWTFILQNHFFWTCERTFIRSTISSWLLWTWYKYTFTFRKERNNILFQNYHGVKWN